MRCTCLNLNDVEPDETSVDPLCPRHGYEAEGGPADRTRVYGVWVVPAGELDLYEFGPHAWLARGEGDDAIHVLDAVDTDDLGEALVLDGTSHLAAIFMDEDDAHTWVEGRTGQKILPRSVYTTP